MRPICGRATLSPPYDYREYANPAPGSTVLAVRQSASVFVQFVQAWERLAQAIDLHWRARCRRRARYT